MTHPITPPLELVQQWADMLATHTDTEIFGAAAQWGADTELEACCEYVHERLKLTTAVCIAQELRAARRPKPPSLKEQALQALNDAIKMADDVPPEGICSDQADIIRRALEALPE